MRGGMKTPRRSVSKLLMDAYSRLCASEDGFITDCIYDAWEATNCGEAVIAEAFVSLEKAAPQITNTRRISAFDVETNQPDSIPALFRAAVSMTERRTLRT